MFAVIRKQWDLQLKAKASGAPPEYYDVFMDHAAQIAAEVKADPKYGLYGLMRGKETQRGYQACDAIAHVNHKLPKTSKAEVRVVWNLLAPRYQYEATSPTDLALILSGLMGQTLALCLNEMKSKRYRMYLGNMADRNFAAAVAIGLQGLSGFQVAVHGNWLHITTGDHK